MAVTFTGHKINYVCDLESEISSAWEPGTHIFVSGNGKHYLMITGGGYIQVGTAVSAMNNNVSRNINGTGFQVAANKVSNVNYTVQITATLNLTTGQTGTVFLEISPDNITWVEISRFVNSNTGSLSIGLSTAQMMTGQLAANVQSGYYVRLRQVSIGSPTITYITGQEIIF